MADAKGEMRKFIVLWIIGGALEKLGWQMQRTR